MAGSVLPDAVVAAARAGVEVRAPVNAPARSGPDSPAMPPRRTAVAAATAVLLGGIAGLSGPLRAGAFTGALTSTPALAAATTASGSTEPAIGYALGYPLGVTVAIVVVAVVIGRRWPSRRDPEPAAGLGLDAVTARVDRPTLLAEVPGFADGQVRMSYLSREGRTRVVAPDEQLQPGDRVVVVGPSVAVAAAVGHLGTLLTEHLAHDRTSVDHRRFVVSEPGVVGRTIAELDIPGRFGGVITRVRRGDLDLLARNEHTLELGDRVLAVVPREELGAVSAFLGDSERRVSEIDALSVGIGMALGLLLGLVTIPLPGGAAFALGSAAGPLLVGMVLGRMERTGPMVWGLPRAARKNSSPSWRMVRFAAQAFTATGARVIAVVVAVIGVASVLFMLGARLVGVSAPRAAGGLAGLVGQPAVLAYAGSRVTDERVEAGYAALFALGIIVKILAVQLIVVL